MKPKEIEINKALEFLKSKHNGELPYKFGTQEIGRWMAEYANQYEPFPKFYKRLKSFIKNIQVNDLMGTEEKEMIMHICEEFINKIKI